MSDSGAFDTIAARNGDVAVTMAGSSAVVFGGIGLLSVTDASTAPGATVAFGLGGGTFSSSGVSSYALVFASSGFVSVNASNTINDAIIGGSGSATP